MIVTVGIRDVLSCRNQPNKEIMLRKFFQMVFVGTDKKSLHIYTAIVVGARVVGARVVGETSDDSFISDLSTGDIRLKVDISVNKIDNNNIKNIKSEDITLSPKGKNSGFIDQIECIKRVWGPKCCIINENKQILIDKIKELTDEELDKDSEELDKDSKEIIDSLVRERLLWIEHDKKDKEENKKLMSLAIPAKIDIDNKSEENSKNNDEIEKTSSYIIYKPLQTKFIKGIELVSWVKTTIDFEYKICDKNMNFILKNSGDNNDCYFSPDFTWYFSPAPGSIIDNKNSILEIKRKNRSLCTMYDCCDNNKECSLKKTFLNLPSEKIQNGITPVPNLLTVDFQYWTEDEKIKQRQKYRISAKDFLSNPQALNDISEINIYIDSQDEHARGNRQFLVGIIISFLLAFGLDSNRINEFGNYLFLNNILSTDICWIIYIVLISFTLLIRPNYIHEVYRKAIKLRRFTLIISFLWIVLSLVIFRLPILKNKNFSNTVFSSIPITNHLCINISLSLILQTLCFAAMIFNVIYLIKYHFSTLKGLVSDVFGEEIL